MVLKSFQNMRLGGGLVMRKDKTGEEFGYLRLG